MDSDFWVWMMFIAIVVNLYQAVRWNLARRQFTKAIKDGTIKMDIRIGTNGND